MELLISAASPFVRTCRVLLREANLMDAVTEVPVQTTPLDTAARVSAANPLGKIPVLVRSDGPAIYDSRVICRFLDDHAGAGLYPTSRLWEVLTLEATAHGIKEAAVAMTYEGRLRPAQEQSASWVSAQWAKAERAIATINTRWISHLSGPLDVAQISVASALSYIDLRHDARNWRNGNDALANWHAAFAARDSMVATRPD